MEAVILAAKEGSRVCGRKVVGLVVTF